MACVSGSANGENALCISTPTVVEGSVDSPSGIKGAFMVLVITRRLASDDAHAYACSRQRPFMCTALGI